MVLLDGYSEVRAAGPGSEWLAAEIEPSLLERLDGVAPYAVAGAAGALSMEPERRRAWGQQRR